MLNLFFAFIVGLLIGILIGLFWFGRTIIKQSMKMIESTYQGAGDEIQHYLLHLFSGVMQKAVIDTQDLETFEQKAIKEAQGAQKAPKEDWPMTEHDAVIKGHKKANNPDRPMLDIILAAILTGIITAAAGSYVTIQVLVSDMHWVHRTFHHIDRRQDRMEALVDHLLRSCNGGKYGQ